jgi:polyferredoxin
VYLANIPGTVDVSEAIYGFLKKYLLSFTQPYYLQGVFIGSLFFFILGINLIERRFWCKYLCPLGAFFGLVNFPRFNGHTERLGYNITL